MNVPIHRYRHVTFHFNQLILQLPSIFCSGRQRLLVIGLNGVFPEQETVLLVLELDLLATLAVVLLAALDVLQIVTTLKLVHPRGRRSARQQDFGRRFDLFVALRSALWHNRRIGFFRTFGRFFGLATLGVMLTHAWVLLLVGVRSCDGKLRAHRSIVARLGAIEGVLILELVSV